MHSSSVMDVESFIMCQPPTEVPWNPVRPRPALPPRFHTRLRAARAQLESTWDGFHPVLERQVLPKELRFRASGSGLRVSLRVHIYYYYGIRS